MGESLPYISTPGTIGSVLRKIQPAKTPVKFDGKFLEEVLLMKGGNPKSFIPFAKKVGLLNADGSPTELYTQFRVQGNKSPAIAECIRKGYAPLFNINENAHNLGQEELKSLVIQVTGQEKDSTVVSCIVSCFNQLKGFADFQASNKKSHQKEEESSEEQIPGVVRGSPQGKSKVHLGYTININLPETTNPAVFNAIFKALKEHILEEPQ
jgi:hypothetical protein